MPSLPDGIRIERFKAIHATDVKALIRSVWEEHFIDHMDRKVRSFFDAVDALADLDNGASAYHDNGGMALVVLDCDIVVGTAGLFRINHDVCELRRMFLDRNYRGQGIGRILAETLINFGRVQRYRRIRLGSNKALVSSHKLYRSLGFTEIPAYEPGGEAYAYYMQLEL